VLEIIRDTGALDYARDLAQAEARMAGEAIADLPRSTFKESLLQLADFAVARSF
jgi:octaprenyl-diphosphate synthase